MNEEKGKEREEERQKANDELGKLKRLVVKVKELEKVKSEYEDQQGKVKELEEKKSKKEKEMESYREDIENKQQEIEKISKVALKKKERELSLQNEKTLLDNVKNYQEVNGKLQKALNATEEKDKELKGLEKDLKGEKERFRNLEQRWRSGQAAILAENLKPNSPCPVCGSPHHPNPAKKIEQIPSDSELDTARKSIDDKETIISTTRDKYSDLKDSSTTLKTRKEDLLRQIREDAGKDIKVLENNVEEAEKLLEESKEAEKNINGIKNDHLKLASDKDKVEKELEDLKKEISEARELLAGKKAVFDEKEKDVPDQLRDKKALDKAIKNAEQEVARLEKNLESANEKFINAEKDFTEKKQAVKSSAEILKNTKKNAKEAEKKFSKRLEKEGFKDEKDYNAFKMTSKDLELLEKNIDEFNTSLKVAEDFLKRAKKAAPDLTEPDVGKKEEKHNNIKDEIERKNKDIGGVENEIKHLNDQKRNLKQILENIEKEEAKYKIVGRLSEVANGNNREGITFQRFVLAALLDNVLDVASKHLHLMSKGRYVLQRVLERGDRRFGAGLDLQVFDSYTGTARPVNTLSGGEGFLASLSLALGLADVVQSYAGGISLETIFIDEGFGSLDPESLDLAFRTLVDLLAKDRLVGIISHVPELKERIDCRLEVTRGLKGSSAKFVV